MGVHSCQLSGKSLTNVLRFNKLCESSRSEKKLGEQTIHEPGTKRSSCLNKTIDHENFLSGKYKKCHRISGALVQKLTPEE